MDILTFKKKKNVMTSSQPIPLNQSLLNFLKILLASCFIGICAQVKIPLYFTPVPLTVQTSAIMLVGALLGSRQGALAALCYLIQGWIGMPVWAGGASGFAHFMGPTGGYLLGYIIQAYMVGWFLETTNCTKFTKIIGVLLLSICIQMGIGSLWLARFVGLEKCFMLGFYPFMITEATKAFLLAIYFRFRNLKMRKNLEAV